MLCSANDVRKLWEKVPGEEAINVYINIPFCMCQCRYCMYKGQTNVSADSRSKFVRNYLVPNIFQFKQEILAHKIDTIYFGGGTPNTISIEDFLYIRNTLKELFDSATNIVIEVNPAFVKADYLERLCREMKPTLISFGVQSFDKESLAFQKRPYCSPEKLKDLILICKEHKVYTSIDLMCYLKNYSRKDFTIFEKDYELAQQMELDFFTVYPELNLVLKQPEAKTDFAKFVNKLPLSKDYYTDSIDYKDLEEHVITHARGIFRVINKKHSFEYFLTNVLAYYEDDFPLASQNIIGFGDNKCNQHIVSYSPKRFFYIEKNMGGIPTFDQKYPC